MTQSFSLTISGAAGAALLNGNYAFEFSGFNSAGAVVAGGSFHADGAGNISAGVEDFNDDRRAHATKLSPAPTRSAPTTAALLLSAAWRVRQPTPSRSIPLELTDASFEFDASGIRGSGQIEKQSVTTCAFNTISGEYAVGITGNSAALGGFSAGPVALAGRFTATPPANSSGQGSIGNGEMDANTPGLRGPSRRRPFPALIRRLRRQRRCVRDDSARKPSEHDFSVYPVSASEFFLVETDAVSANTPFLTVGTLMQQVGFPFSGPAGGFHGDERRRI